MERWEGRLGLLPSLYPGIASSSITCLASRSTMATALLLITLLVDTSSCMGFNLRSSRAKVSRGAKLDVQHGAHLAVHSLEREAGCSACSPDPVEGGEELV